MTTLLLVTARDPLDPTLRFIAADFDGMLRALHCEPLRVDIGHTSGAEPIASTWWQRSWATVAQDCLGIVLVVPSGSEWHLFEAVLTPLLPSTPRQVPIWIVHYIDQPPAVARLQVLAVTSGLPVFHSPRLVAADCGSIDMTLWRGLLEFLNFCYAKPTRL